jgi:hypothetical protein
MNFILSTMPPEEVHDAMWMIDVFERWNMPQEEADEWRRRSAVAFPELKSDKLRTTQG